MTNDYYVGIFIFLAEETHSKWNILKVVIKIFSAVFCRLQKSISFVRKKKHFRVFCLCCSREQDYNEHIQLILCVTINIFLAHTKKEEIYKMARCTILLFFLFYLHPREWVWFDAENMSDSMHKTACFKRCWKIAKKKKSIHKFLLSPFANAFIQSHSAEITGIWCELIMENYSHKYFARESLLMSIAY
jgi:hypothetical protein